MAVANRQHRVRREPKSHYVINVYEHVAISDSSVRWWGWEITRGADVHASGWTRKSEDKAYRIAGAALAEIVHSEPVTPNWRLPSHISRELTQEEFRAYMDQNDRRKELENG